MAFILAINGKVHQVFASDPKYPNKFDVRDASSVPNIAVGWSVNADGSFSPPPATNWPARVPDVTGVQAKIQLSRTKTKDGSSDLLSAATAIVEKFGGEAKLYFDGVGTWQRSNTYVGQIGKALELTDAEMDTLFFEAYKIV